MAWDAENAWRPDWHGRWRSHKPGQALVEQNVARPLLRVRNTGTTERLPKVQIDRLIRQWRETGRIEDRRGGNRGRPFERRYTAADIRLLAEVDEAFGQMSGVATCELLRRQYEVFGEVRFERLAGLSHSHVYNLRASRTHVTKHMVWTRTRAATTAIALREAPDPRGVPGHLRVDTVHQGDQDGVKGIYIINLVDEVTQYEFIGVVRGISERFLSPALEALLLLFPFPVLGFHADNGSEYINHQVAALLNKLHIPKSTKSRARRTNDNALVEGKNAHVVPAILIMATVNHCMLSQLSKLARLEAEMSRNIDFYALLAPEMAWIAFVAFDQQP